VRDRDGDRDRTGHVADADVNEEDLKQRIADRMPQCGVTVPKPGRLIATVPRDGLLSLLHLLKTDGFEHLSLISCVDWIDEGELELVYHLWSQEKKVHAMAKTRVDRASPRMLSVILLFRHAQTYERELHEMFGIDFDGNPRQVPLLLDHWQGIPPMRKEFDLRRHARETFGVEERTDD